MHAGRTETLHEYVKLILYVKNYDDTIVVYFSSKSLTFCDKSAI